jgi:hypothetical protein
MAIGDGIHCEVERQTPAAGAHIFLGQPNIFFVTANCKDGIPWMADPTVNASLAEIWRTEATAWLVGYYLLMPDHLHLFCAPRDPHFGIDQWVKFWKSCFSRRHVAQPWSWQRKSFTTASAIVSSMRKRSPTYGRIQFASYSLTIQKIGHIRGEFMS